MGQPAKARLVVHWNQGKKNEEIPFEFNPSEMAFDKGVQIAEIAIPGLDSPMLQFVRGQNEKLTLDLFFDTTEHGMGAQTVSVTTWTDKVYSLVKIEPERHAPPVCTLHWDKRFPGCDLSDNAGGNQKRHAFTCIVESVRQKFTLFSTEGVPLRATLTVAFREYKVLDQQPYQQNPSSPDRTHSHILGEGETLSGIAERYYGRAGEWRAIADFNNINDPRRISAGQPLAVPPIE